MIQICPKCHSDNPPNSRVCTTCGLQLDIVDNMSLPDTGTQDAPKKELKRGTTFADRYEVIEELGRGGMGKVYRVEDTKIKEELALKLINPEVASEKKTIERFINELKGAHKISHRNVCRMYHLGEDKGTYYITMEYVPGEDLKSMIRMTRHLSIGTAVSIVKQVCLGLAEAHRLGVVHRDLKPSNIMIDRDGNARIMDFGIARLYSEKGITEAGIMIGTPEYMSPEQVEALDTDSRSDIYSLGVILYEMVTGRLPFVGETSLMTAVKHKTEIPPDPRKLNAQIPIELSQIILKCLEKNKDKRYQSAEDMLADLNTIEKDMTTSEKALPKRKRILYKEKKDRPMKIWRIAAALVAAALIIGLGIVLLTRQKTQVPLERKMLEEAVEIDPGFALAYVRMSYIHSRMYFFGIDRTDERKTLSRIAINTALELQPELPEAQLTLGFYFHIDLAYAMVYYAIQNGTLLNSFAVICSNRSGK